MNKCEQCGKLIDSFHVVLAYDTGDQHFCDNECLNLYIKTKKEQDLEEQIKELKLLVRELAEVLGEAQRYIEDVNDLYGEGLEVANWHFNGELEPFDNLIGDDGPAMAECIKAMSAKAKGVLSDG